MIQKVEKEFHGTTISFETGRVAKQASGSIVVRAGESTVLVTACMGEERDAGFLPLSIDYVEKTYAAGKIPGGYFKREGRLSEFETLTSRLIDRPIRPLFPDTFSRELQVIATVLSADPMIDTDMLALCGASAALTVSEIPFEGPIAGVRVGKQNGKLVINPPHTSFDELSLNFIVAASRDAIVMVEGGAQEASEDEVLEALFYAHEQIKILIDLQSELREKAGKPKIDFVPKQHDAALSKQIHEFAVPKLKEALRIQEKLARKDAIKAVKEEVKAKFIDESAADAEQVANAVAKIFEDLVYDQSRQLVFDTGRRLDGRDTVTVRPLDIEVGYLPRTHGSAFFQRGETQAIVTATLGVEEDAQRIDSLHSDYTKSFLLHYNFPPFSVGEVRMLRGAGRREIGHGALAERAVKAVVPSRRDFPYVIRIVSEITESNGSSSMASVCGASLALMDAGVPLKAPVAGIAMGLLAEGDKTAILTDILGDEDHLGDMDFKVCGTENGITALQMDIKIKGLKAEIMTNALRQAKDARLHILGKMGEVIRNARADVSRHAPRIETFKIATDKIRELIGPGGKTIKGIQESWGVKINIEDNGTVTVSGTDYDKLMSALEICKSITAKPEVGKLYKGIVKRIADFGAFVEILPGTDGLVHISQLADHRVNDVRDVVQEGDEVHVKVLEIDRQGKIRLSLKDAIAEMQGGSSQADAAGA